MIGSSSKHKFTRIQEAVGMDNSRTIFFQALKVAKLRKGVKGREGVLKSLKKESLDRSSVKKM